jgi:hypothetical protein
MSDAEQTSPMVEKDKDQVPDGTGSTQNDGKKGRFNRLKRRVKVGKNFKSVSFTS